MDIQELLNQHKDDVPALQHALEQQFGFPGGFWHPTDVDGALDVLGARARDFGISASIPRELLESALADAGDIRTDEDEDLARRHQTGAAARYLNQQLGGESRHFRPFDNETGAWEDGEPLWLFISAQDTAQLTQLGVLTPPQALERGYYASE